jgi:hypothetical protein
VLGSSLILLITSRVLRFYLFLEIKQTLVPVCKFFFGNSGFTSDLFLFIYLFMLWGGAPNFRNLATQKKKKKGWRIQQRDF